MVEKKAKSSERFLTVGEAAAYLGVTATTLRNWDKTGKLTPRRHPINGYRLYAETDIEALKNVITGKTN
jgi:excisionase family DNA binding protein